MRIALILAILSPLVCTGGPTIQSEYAERVANAIYRAEGGDGTRYPYGIIAKRRLTEREARRWCVNTIRNTWGRWQQAGGQGEYIEFLARRYAPVGPGVANDPQGLNRNWLRNVRAILN